jgi:hypothetical protein
MAAAETTRPAQLATLAAPTHAMLIGRGTL